MLDMGYEIGDTLSLIDSMMVNLILPGYEHYAKGTDGLPNQVITIYTKDTTREIVMDQYVLSPKNYYYRFNSKKAVYTLRILFEQEFESMKSSVELLLKMEELGFLNSLGRLDIESNPEYYERFYEEQIQYWINLAEHELGKNWELKKKKSGNK